MFVDKVFYDVFLLQGGYVPDDSGGPLTVRKYSILNVSPLSVQDVSDFVDELVGCLGDCDIPVSSRYLRVRGVDKRRGNGHNSSVKYVAVCGWSHWSFHDDAIRVVEPCVRDVVMSYPVVIETGYVDLSVHNV